MLQEIIPLWAHQKKAVELSETTNHLALFFEQGTGKTATTINIHRNKSASEGRHLRTIVVCPLIVCENWVREFHAHSPYGGRSHVLRGTSAQRIKQFGLFLNKSIVIINFEALQMPELFAVLKKWQPEFLIIDEAHKLKNPTGARPKKMLELSDGVKYRYILTGTPILNSPMDVYMPFKIMHPHSFDFNFFKFRKKYFYNANADKSWATWPDWKFQKSSEAEFKSIIEKHSMKVLKSECLDLPPLVKQTVFAPLHWNQLTMYKAMEKDLVAYMDDHSCVATIALTKVLRLQQIVAGFMRDAETGEDIPFHGLPPRLAALSELLEEICVENNKKVIVWCNFKYSYTQIYKVCNDLKLKYVCITGQQNAEEKQASIDSFQNDPAFPVCIANPSAGGVGINLTAASYMIFYTRSYNLEHDLQAEARCFRGGSEIHDKITRIDIVAPDTIDEVVLKALAHKINVATDLLNFNKLLKR